jgi:hypothetical protein
MGMARPVKQKFFYRERKSMIYEHWLYDDAILRTELLALAIIGLLVFLDKRKRAKKESARRRYLRAWINSNLHV